VPALVARGLAAQRSDGAFTHLGGHDTGFHAMRLLYLHWLLPWPSGEGLEAAAARAGAWLAGRVRPDGTIDLTDNTASVPAAGGYHHARETRWALALHAARFDPALLARARRLWLSALEAIPAGRAR
jgi:hypothetical protein